MEPNCAVEPAEQLAAHHRENETGGQPRAGAGRDDRRLPPVPPGLDPPPREQRHHAATRARGDDRAGARADRSPGNGRQGEADPGCADGARRPGAAHRLCQRGESDGRPGGTVTAGNGDRPGARGLAPAHLDAGSAREPRDRHGGADPRAGRRDPDAGASAAARAGPSGARRLDGCARLRRIGSPGASDDDRAGDGHRPAEPARWRDSRAQRRGSGREALGSQEPHRRAACPVGRGPGLCRPVHTDGQQAAPCRSRVSSTSGC